MLLHFAGVEDCSTDERAANEITGHTSLWADHTPPVYTLHAVGMERLHLCSVDIPPFKSRMSEVACPEIMRKNVLKSYRF
jgi:hypothetical protein